MKIILFGIPNCDKVKKARKYLEHKSIRYDFFDFKKTKPTRKNIDAWTKSLGELPVNKRGTTYRKLKDQYEKSTTAGKIKLLQEETSLIKRPILEIDGKVLAIGFSENLYLEVIEQFYN